MENISSSTSDIQIDDLTWREHEVLSLLAVHLTTCAGPIAALGFPVRAARLLGAANAHQEIIGTYQQPANQPEIEAYIKAARKELGEKAFQEAWFEGERMAIQEAVAYVLNNKEAKD